MGTARERVVAEIEREPARFPGTGGVAAKHMGTGCVHWSPDPVRQDAQPLGRPRPHSGRCPTTTSSSRTVRSNSAARTGGPAARKASASAR